MENAFKNCELKIYYLLKKNQRTMEEELCDPQMRPEQAIV
jgi:hypothetical protein